MTREVRGNLKSAKTPNICAKIIIIEMKKHHFRNESLSSNKRQRSNAKIEHQQQQQHSGRHRQVENSTVCSWMDYDSMESIQSLSSTTITRSKVATSCIVSTPVASSTMTEIFLNRLHKEIILPFRFTLSSQIQLLDSDQTIHEAIERRNLIQQRIMFGYNNVSKVLFEAHSNKTTKKPSLIVMVNLDNSSPNESLRVQQPPSTFRIGAAMLQHIPVLANNMKIPFLILPSSYWSDDPSRGKVENNTIHTLSTMFGFDRHRNTTTQFSLIAFIHRPQQHHNPEESLGLHNRDDYMSIERTAHKTNIVENSNNDEKQQQHIHDSIDSFINFITGKMKN
jgi:hypothetical protein